MSDKRITSGLNSGGMFYSQRLDSVLPVNAQIPLRHGPVTLESHNAACDGILDRICTRVHIFCAIRMQEVPNVALLKNTLHGCAVCAS